MSSYKNIFIKKIEKLHKAYLLDQVEKKEDNFNCLIVLLYFLISNFRSRLKLSLIQPNFSCR